MSDLKRSAKQISMKQNLFAAIILAGAIIFAAVHLSDAIKELAVATSRKKEIDIGFKNPPGYQLFDAQGLKVEVKGNLKIEDQK
jgi:hypothetical protein